MQRFVDSFKHYATADILLKWSAFGGSTTIASGGRNGGNCLRLPTLGNVSKTLDNQATWICGFAFKIDQNPSGAALSLIAFLDSTTVQMNVQINTNGTLSVTRGGTILTTTGSAVPLNTYQHIAFKATIHNTTGSYELRINDAAVLSGSGINTRTSANNYANVIRIGQQTNLGATTLVDDFYLFDGTGSTNNNFVGDVAIGCYFPDGAGDLTQWTPSTGNNYQCVDDASQNGDTDYVSSASAGNYDLYTFGNISGAAVSIYGVQRTLVARKDDAGTRTLKPSYKGGGVVYDGTGVNITTSYLCYSDTLETDPATGVAWTNSGLNAAQFGVKHET